MAKYVFDIDTENPYVDKNGNKVYVATSGAIYEHVVMKGLEPLTPEYVKENFSELIEAAHANGYEAAERIWHCPGSENEFYRKGLEDAWELAKMIAYASMHGGVVSLCPDLYVEDFHSCADTFEAFTVHEALAKLKAYEQKKAQDLEIKVGDEVEFINDREGREGDKHIVSYTYGEKFDGIDDNGMTCEGCDIHDVRKTGKHYNIAELLKKMKEGEDEE